MSVEDPFYTGQLARFLADRLDSICGFQVVTDPLLTRVAEVVTIDHDKEIVRLVPGLSLRDYHVVLARAGLRVTHGPEAVPEFTAPRPKLSIVDAIPRTPRPLRPGHGIVKCPECRARFGLEG